MTREQELSAAIEEAVLPSRDYRIFSALLRQRAEWKTANIQAKFQPRGLADLARLAKMSKASLCRGLEHLESHGWITRTRADKRGPGHRTTYQLTRGMSCDCLKQRPEPASDADRARRYRERKRAAALAKEVSQVTVTQEAISVSESRDEVSQDDVTKCLTSRDEIPGQGQFSAKEGVEEGKGEGSVANWPDPDQAWLTPPTFPGSWSAWDEGTNGAWMNRSTDTSDRRAA
jgi:DNA-binding PadR family transcriptional regulator